METRGSERAGSLGERAHAGEDEFLGGGLVD